MTVFCVLFNLFILSELPGDDSPWLGIPAHEQAPKYIGHWKNH